MNSDLQRYHIRMDGLITKTPVGEWVRYEDVEKVKKKKTKNDPHI